MKKYTLLFLFSLIFVFGCTQGYNELPTEEQKLCGLDEDCVTVVTGCDGCSCGEPINKEFKQQYLKNLNKKCKFYSGSVCDRICVIEYLDVPEFTCEDQEGAKDYYKNGLIRSCIYSNCAQHSDLCGSEPNILFEKYCENDTLQFEMYTCPNSCEDGVCT